MRIAFFTLISILLFGCNKPDVSNYQDVTDESGKIHYKFNPLDSTAVLFPASNIYLTGKLVDSKKEGPWSEYRINEDYKSFERTYKNDVENGKFYAFTSTGKIELTGNKKNASKDGFWVYFDLDGKPERVELFRAVANHAGMSDFIYSKELK